MPMGFGQPKPTPAKTHTLVHGCRYPWVQVWVSLENPRVAHDIPTDKCLMFVWVLVNL